MIALTQEKREELAHRLETYIKFAEIHIKAGLATEEDLFNLEVRKIALASLTALPFGWEIAGNIFPTLEEALKPGYIGTPEPIYDEPPLPEIKLIEPADFIGTWNNSDDCPLAGLSAKSAANKAVSAYAQEIKRLNGWGE